ncbi:ParM/StbA family protein [Acidithiobacillus ferridurans]|uniref:ParM/StbA family protein n=1 Tax=Acidithiobacillus ferridurans TaxID=1232575 RepID=A0A8X8KB41_ACIFI|nr:ParM/StbA family protein [Acidithiobacillus ferridurans]MBU2715810.1 ParM/StbA family protein [Acidithiobacillus ferridurans]MBU2722807.1 ParM/StbA family protein [Acidithiobacillus ferridurans]MBU2727806.1 ParM/StbA family protein [Acidithiobacillus ferridurans]
MGQFVIGMDIGYSNLKVCFGDTDDGSPMDLALPAVSAPVASVSSSLTGMHDEEGDGGVRVQVNGEAWLAGIPPSMSHRVVRELHEGYVGSPAWTALAHAGMLLGGRDTIDRLVVGLPVHHFEDLSRRKALRDLLSGAHQVTPKRRITVNRVSIVPQPIGAFFDALQWHRGDGKLEDEPLLVIDPGYFSVDWTLVHDMRYDAGASSSSMNAMSRLIEVTRSMMKEDYGAAPSQSLMEDAVRMGKQHMRIFEASVEIEPYLRKAAQSVAVESLSELRTNIRQVDTTITYLLLAGGGAELYADAARTVFPRSAVLRSASPFMANARGFWHFGVHLEAEDPDA